MPKSKGWIKLHRELLDWELFDDVKATYLWIYLLLKANTESCMFMGQKIERGQAVVSYQSIAKHTGLSVQEARTALAKIKSTGSVTCRTTSKFTVVSIVCYDSYQSKQHAGQHTEQHQLKNIYKKDYSGSKRTPNNQPEEERWYD